MKILRRLLRNTIQLVACCAKCGARVDAGQVMCADCASE